MPVLDVYALRGGSARAQAQKLGVSIPKRPRHRLNSIAMRSTCICSIPSYRPVMGGRPHDGVYYGMKDDLELRVREVMLGG